MGLELTNENQEAPVIITLIVNVLNEKVHNEIQVIAD